MQQCLKGLSKMYLIFSIIFFFDSLKNIEESNGEKLLDIFQDVFLVLKRNLCVCC